VLVLDVYLLQPTRRAEGTLRGSIETDHRRDLVMHWIAPDKVQKYRRQIRVGNAILQLLKYKS
jgi:hypothetical protein